MHRFITFLKTEILIFTKQFPPNFACDNGWELTKVNSKTLSDVVKFSILSSDILLDFHE